uniref:26S proteasome non-ATPase regulatory subunit 14 n=1 Tax=Arundo donax TaxID=35708 RepID=A0A0A9FK66_ARUDO
MLPQIARSRRAEEKKDQKDEVRPFPRGRSG